MKAIVNSSEFNIIEKGGSPALFAVNGKPLVIDMIRSGADSLHVIFGSRSYRACLVEYDRERRIAVIKVNNCRYNVKMKDESDEILERLGLTVNVRKPSKIRAPMPGKVIEIMVKEGDKVNTGDSLLILEAMKMENIIKAPYEGVIRKLPIKKGTAVEKNQELVILEN